MCFSLAGNLEKHRAAVHLKLKPHKCNTCGTLHIKSKATAWCPADRRAATTQGHTQSWGYRDSGNWRNGDIRIKCNVYDVDNACNVM